MALCLLVVGFSCSKDEPLEDPPYALDVYVGNGFLIIEDYEKIGEDAPPSSKLRNLHCRKYFYQYEKDRHIPGIRKEGAKFRIFDYVMSGAKILPPIMFLKDIKPRK